MPNNTLNSNLLNLLSNLNKKEHTEFGKWLRSPVHNNSKGIVQLYEGIKGVIQGDKVKSIFHLDMLKYIGALPRSAKQQNITSAHKKTLEQLTYKLNVQLKDYLIWKKVKGDDILSNQQFIETLLIRGMHNEMAPIIKQTKKKLHNYTYRDIYYCESAFKLSEMEFFLSKILHNRNSEIVIGSTQNLLDRLREYNLSYLLKYLCAATSLEQVFDAKLDYPLREAIRQHLATHPDKEQASVGVYYRLLELLLNQRPEDYQELKAFLFENLNVFETGEIRQFFNHMTNSCTLMIRNQNTNFITEKHEIYEKGLELECWTKNMFFSEFQFVHIVRNALLLEDKEEWTANFIIEYQSTLRQEVKDYVCSFCNALLAYHNKQFKEAMNRLPTQEVPKDFAYFLDIKILKVKIHYDSDDWGFLPNGGYAILNELENIYNYVNHPSREITQNIRKQYTNFINIFKRIFNRKRRLDYPDDTSPVTQANLQALQNDLTHLKPLIERTWLEEKVTELMAALE